LYNYDVTVTNSVNYKQMRGWVKWVWCCLYVYTFRSTGEYLT